MAAPDIFPLMELPTGTDRSLLLATVDVYHPGYRRLRPLISLRASDKGTIHYDVIYYACCITAGNKWSESEGKDGRGRDDAYLSRSRKHSDPAVDISNNTIPAGKYYFHIPGYEKAPYPITTQFYHWCFPSELPKPWRFLQLPNLGVEPSTTAVELHSESCRVTAERNMLNMCHIVPKTARRWFNESGMHEYPTVSVVRSKPMESYCNLMALRTDIHRAFDHSNIVPFPKPDPEADGTYTLRTHVLVPPAKSTNGDLEMIVKYHNRPLYPILGVPPEFLFARFAWCLFTDSIMLLPEEKETEIAVLMVDDKATDERTSVPDSISGDDLPRPRAGNSKYDKITTRKHNHDEMQEEIDYGTDDAQSVTSIDSCDSAYYDHFFDNIYGDSSYESTCSSQSDGEEDEHPTKKRVLS
ncbi:hypothetical protein GGR54DRAFT_141673 [Hypoxylon sp. NC1633]|nr:hypothetical protein GGR54DRAFT_141673 [Hypoxylon sp. NC1633]